MNEDERTPPKIVASARSQDEALAAFIAQELEAWGFAVEGDRARLIVDADGYKLSVVVAA